MQAYNPSSISFSTDAIAHFLNMLNQNKNSTGIRIGTKIAGCSGYEYFFDYVDTFDDGGVVFEKNGCKIFVDNSSLDFLKGSLVDYQKDGLNQGIKFVNPNAKAVCGCGESFTI